MEQQTHLIFGYGSLMNRDSVLRTVCPNHIDHGWDYMVGWERIFNLPFKHIVFLNIQPHPEKEIIGKIIEVTDYDLANLKDREVGYDLTDVSDSIKGEHGQPVYTFVSKPKETPGGIILQSYLNRCMTPLNKEDRRSWLEACIINNDISPDEPPIEH